nr:MAG: polymerase PB2 [Xinjiang sediment orthomyxo-like virus 5]
MNTRSIDERKNIVLTLCKAITRAKQGSIDVLRSNPICNLKYITQASKNLKDPNPLSSMITAITTKYPISVDTKKAKEKSIPEEFLGPLDTHYFGRRLCKLEAIGWSIEHSPPVNIQTKQTIDVLFKTKIEAVKEYYEYDWEHSTVRFKETLLVRSLVPTNRVLVDVPVQQRVTLLIACILPDYLMPWMEVSNELLDKLCELRDVSLASKMALHTQLRILLNFMDPRPRVIPSLVGESTKINRIRYVFASPYHRVITPEIQRVSDDKYNNLTPLLGKCCVLASLKYSSFQIINELHSMRINGESVRTILDMTTSFRSIYSKFLQCVFNGLTSPTLVDRSVEFVPQSDFVIPTVERNKTGHEYKTYKQLELVFFNYNGIKGVFTHLGEFVSHVNCMKCSLDEAKHIFACIGCYCRVGYNQRSGNMKQMHTSAYNEFLKDPHLVMKTTKDVWNKCFKGILISPINFGPEIDYQLPQPIPCRFDRNTIVFQNGCEVTVPVPKEQPMLPENTIYNGKCFNPYVYPNERLKRLVKLYLQNDNSGILLEKIRVQDWTWGNDGMMDGFSTKDKGQIAFEVQVLLCQLDRSKAPITLIAALYCFAGIKKPAALINSNTHVFIWYNTFKLDLKFVEGIIRITDGKLLICSEIIKVEEVKIETLLTGFLLHEYNVVEGYDQGLVKMSIGALERRNIKDGSRFQINIYGKNFIVQKDSTAATNLQRTYQRQIENISSGALTENLINVLKGMKRAHPVDDDEAGPSKKMNVIPDDHVEVLADAFSDEEMAIMDDEDEYEVNLDQIMENE